MTRIIGGRAGGLRLATPRGDSTRPTSDRVREALFSAVEARCGTLAGLRFLDLYAGSGAVGLEAWSRGATVTLVEQDRRTAAIARSNARSIGLERPEVVVGAVAAALARAPVTAYDAAFLDPPYPLSEEDLADVLVRLADGDWLVPGGLVVVERSSRSPEPAWPVGIERERDRRYGETRLWYARRSPAPEHPVRWYGREAASPRDPQRGPEPDRDPEPQE